VLVRRWLASWKGDSGDQNLYYAVYDGLNWSPQVHIPGVWSSVGPALCEYNGKLYAAWKGSGNDESLWYASFDGTSWSPQVQFPGVGVASSVGPSLAVFVDKLYAAWKGDSSDQGIYYATFDGSEWSTASTITAQIPGVGSSVGPALCEYNGKLYAMWKGVGNDVRLFFASFDGSKWSAQAKVPGNTGQDAPQNIGLRMQYQETSEWCWIAVATSINHFYDPSSTATQCAIMTTIGQTINGFPLNTSACPNAKTVASVPGLAAALANPYSKTAEGVLTNLIPTEYVKTGGVNTALSVSNNLNSVLPSLTLEQITTEISAGRPIAVDIAWNSGGQHCVAIAGVLDEMLLICDPIYGQSVIQYESFPSAYQGGASLVAACLTQGG